MNYFSRTLYAFATVVVFSLTSTVNAVEFSILSTGQNSDMVTSTAISDDGSTVVGYYQTEDGWDAFRWTQQEGLQLLYCLDVYGCKAEDVSADGSKIVGSVYIGVYNKRAAYWAGASSMPGPGISYPDPGYETDPNFGGTFVPEGDSNSESFNSLFIYPSEGPGYTSEELSLSADRISADGSIVMGTRDNRQQESIVVLSETGNHFYTSIASAVARVEGITDDGHYLGWYVYPIDEEPGQAEDYIKALIYPQVPRVPLYLYNESPQDLSRVLAVSRNNFFTVGESGGFASLTQLFNEYGAPSQIFKDIDSQYSSVSSVANNGTVVGANDIGALVWTEEAGTFYIHELLLNAGIDLQGITLTQAIDISVDGNSVTGVGRDSEGNDVSWVVQGLFKDQDSDGMYDYWEQQYNLNVLDPSDALGDSDGDGLTNLTESQNGLNPESSDTDIDGLNDYFEFTYRGFDPFEDQNSGHEDYDLDGLLNKDESLLGTNPLMPDTDGDGTNDSDDVFPTDGSEWLDSDSDGLGDNIDTDDDNDGLSDLEEQQIGTDPVLSDTDGDGVPDGEDAFPLDASRTGVVVLLDDDFNRADNALLGQSWQEFEASGVDVELINGQMVFSRTYDAPFSPVAQYEFLNAESGVVRASWDFSAQRLGSEGDYRIFMQLGDVNTWHTGSFTDGVATNLVWTQVSGSHQSLALASESGYSLIQAGITAGTIEVVADLDSRVYSVFIDGLEVAVDVPLGNAQSINGIRFFTDKVNHFNFSSITFDNVFVQLDQNFEEPEPVATYELSEFTAEYFNDGVLVHSEMVDSPAINYSGSNFHNIPSRDFSSVWKGELNVLGEVDLDLDVYFDMEQSDVTFIVNGVQVDSWSNNGKTLRHTFRSGVNTLEVRYVNNGYYAGFNVTFSAKTIYDIERVATELEPLIDANDEIIYLGAHEASDLYNTIHVNIEDDAGPLVLFLSAYKPVNWNVIIPDGAEVKAVVYEAPGGSSVSSTQAGVPIYPVGGLLADYRDFSYVIPRITEMAGRAPTYTYGDYSLGDITLTPQPELGLPVPIFGEAWQLFEANGGTVEASGDTLVFTDTSDLSLRPMAQHVFSATNQNQVVASWQFDWARIGDEGKYDLYMQLGDGQIMSENSATDGVGVNLVWSHGSSHQTLFAQASGQSSALSILQTGLVEVRANVVEGRYSIFIDGQLVADGISFDQSVSELNTIRFFTNGLNEMNFSGRSFSQITVN